MNSLVSIKGKTIQMQKPLVLDNTWQRSPVMKSELSESLVSKEEILRRLAYKNSLIKTGESFFDDSDMNSDYYLTVIYDEKTGTPLLSARYYLDKSAIDKCLKGGKSAESIKADILNLGEFEHGKLFLADRLSGNISSKIYRRYRSYIYLSFYAEIISRNKGRDFILMARKEKHDKLLKKYLRLGLTIIGSTMHKDKEHWILLGNVNKSYSERKLSVLYNIILKTKILLTKLNKHGH